MKLIRPKVWNPMDLVCLKWSSILFGMVAGAYLSGFTRRHVRGFAIGMIILAIRPVVAWFRDSE